MNHRTTYLPCHEPPKLSILPNVRDDLDVQVVPRIGDGCEQRADNGGEDKELADGRVGEARGYHRDWWEKRMRITQKSAGLWVWCQVVQRNDDGHQSGAKRECHSCGCACRKPQPMHVKKWGTLCQSYEAECRLDSL